MQRTPLHDDHKRLGAVLTDFHGWEMPVRYSSIPAEHALVRSTAGLFDLCHMGRLEIRGPEASAWLQRILTNDWSALAVGDARYTLILNEAGTIIDDAIVYRIADDGHPRALLVVNASNREAVIDWMNAHRGSFDAELIDRSEEFAMIAIQGQTSVTSLAESAVACDADLGDMPYYSIANARVFDKPAWVARTGYTGEDGFEIYLDAGNASRLWSSLLEAGGDAIGAIGLGARDTLRLEAGMPLYGNELDTTTNPYEAGLGFAVKLKKGDFLGRDALLQLRETGPARRLRGFKMAGKRAARHGMAIFDGEREVGVVTSGAPSPTVGCPIAMGYLATDLSEDAELAVDVRGRREGILRTDLPFFSRVRKKRKNPA